MDTNQQQQQQTGVQPIIQPTLADLDKPPVQQQQQQNPPPPPPPNNQPDQQKPGEGESKGEEEPEKVGEEEENTDETEEVDDPVAFYTEVSQLRGDGFKFTFPEDVDPTTPAGVHHAFNQLLEYELDRFEQDLQKGDQRAYAYMLHRANGGSDEDFFATKTEVLPEWEVLKGSVDLQQAFYRRALTRKEMAPDQIDILVKDAIDKNKLTGIVEVEYNRMKKQDEDQAKRLLAISEENQKKERQLIQKMGATLQEKIIENKGLGITIPDAKRGGFLQFVNQLVNLDERTGQWYIQHTLTPENMNVILESLYYMSVGGNMEEIISKKAQQQNVKQLKLNMGKDKTKKNTERNPNQTQTKPGVQPALRDI